MDTIREVVERMPDIGDGWEQHLLPAPNGGGHTASERCWCDPVRTGDIRRPVFVHSEEQRVGGDCCTEETT